MQSSVMEIKNIVKEKAKASRLEKRDEVLKEYLEHPNPEGKKQFCLYFLRGTCILPAEQCHFVHRVSDLVFEKPDLELYLEKIKNLNQKENRADEEEKIIAEFYQKKTHDEKYKGQPSLQLEATFKVLYDFQPKMIEDGELPTPYTQEEIDTNIKVRGYIRDNFRKDLQGQLVKFFFEQYNNVQFLPRGFIDLCFLKVGWFCKSKMILHNRCCHEADHPIYGKVILQLPNDQDFIELIENCVIKIIKRHNLLEKLPLKASNIIDLYEKDLMTNDAFLPHINFLRFRLKTTVDEILQRFQKKESFIKKLAKELDLKEEDLKEMEIFEHEKDSNVKQREKVIQAYHSKEIVDGKSQMCRFFIRGCCIFDAKDCRFAHGTADLNFKRINIEEYDGKYSDGKRREEYRVWERSWADILREQQPSLHLEFTYKVLYNYQFKSIEQGRMKESYSQEKIDSEDSISIRHLITVHMLTDETKQFMNLLFQTYQRKFLKKAFIDHCFQSVAWLTNWNRILDDEFCYEAKDPKHGFVILKIPPLEEFNDFIENCVVKIIKDNSLLDHLPISSLIVSKHFYKDFAPKDPLMPTLNIYLKRVKITLDEYLMSLQTNQNFISKLAKECNKTEEELKSVGLFDSLETELQTLMQKMKKILHDLIEKSRIGFILFNRFEEAVKKRCTKEVVRFNHNSAFLRKVMRGIAMASGVLVIALLSEDYLFSPKKLKDVDYEGMSKKYLTKLYTKCKKKEITHPMNQQNPLITKDEINPAEQKDNINEENLDQEINLQKIKVVDDEESLKEAKSYIKNYEIIAVDLEGNLNKGGRIELIQIACGDLIFIFDVYKVQGAPELQEVSHSLVAFIKEIMENYKICKVFHDCRKDSFALHLFTHCCPVNVFDVSAMHTLIQHLEIFMPFKEDLFGLSTEEKKEDNEDSGKLKADLEKGLQILACTDDMKSPGLNDVLVTYGASHGINHLKHIMKKKFEEMPREYFLIRPLDKEYLIYSAKDVEDLVEVKYNIEKKLFKVLEQMINLGNKDVIELLWKKASKTYALYGCTASQS